MRHSRTAEEIGTLNIEIAARVGKPPGGPVGGISGDHILHIPATREVPGAEPVDVTGINGREALGWERALIEAARMRERARERRP